MCFELVNLFSGCNRSQPVESKQSKQNYIIAWITSPRLAQDKEPLIVAGSPAADLPTCPLTATSNDRLCANKSVSHFQRECASVCLRNLPSSTTFSLSLSWPHVRTKTIGHTLVILA